MDIIESRVRGEFDIELESHREALALIAAARLRIVELAVDGQEIPVMVPLVAHYAGEVATAEGFKTNIDKRIIESVGITAMKELRKGLELFVDESFVRSLIFRAIPRGVTLNEEIEETVLLADTAREEILPVFDGINLNDDIAAPTAS